MEQITQIQNAAKEALKFELLLLLSHADKLPGIFYILKQYLNNKTANSLNNYLALEYPIPEKCNNHLYDLCFTQKYGLLNYENTEEELAQWKHLLPLIKRNLKQLVPLYGDKKLPKEFALPYAFCYPKQYAIVLVDKNLRDIFQIAYDSDNKDLEILNKQMGLHKTDPGHMERFIYKDRFYISSI